MYTSSSTSEVRCFSAMFSCFFFFKQKTAYEMRISDWSSDVCSSDLVFTQSIASELTPLVGSHSRILIRQSLNRVSSTIGDADRMQLDRAKFRHLIVGRPAYNIGHTQICSGRCDARTGVHYPLCRPLSPGAATAARAPVFSFGRLLRDRGV